MKKAPIPSNETERLKTLMTYNILDSDPEPEFDRIVELVADVCECPIALISFFDLDRQWFKAKVGLEGTESPRDISFCGHALLSDGLFVVEDALQSDTFRKNPYVIGAPGIRFYAGYPLINGDGIRLGTLAVVDRKPRELTAMQTKSLEVLAQQIMSPIELRRTNDQLRVTVKRLDEQSRILEEQKHKAILNAKLASLGVVAAGVTHEIKSPLSMIKVYTEKLRSHLDEPLGDTEIVAIGAEVDNFTGRISDIVDSMKTISRGAPTNNMDTVSASQIINGSLKLVNDKIKKSGARVDIEGNTHFQLECRPGELSQILVNLIDNALDAIESSTDKWIKVNVESDDDYVMIQVQDSGEGIDAGLEDKILEPFFTTKAIGKGTGLGLSLCATIAGQHHGDFKLLRDAPHTTFQITLPRWHSQEQILGIA